MWICHFWFGTRVIENTPRQMRLETLRFLFKDGFGDLDAIMYAATLQRRVACQFAKLFVKHPRLGWLTDLFFLRIYHPLVKTRDALHS